MKAPNTPQRVVLVTAAAAVLALAFYPPFFPRHVRSGRFDIELAAVTLATIFLLLALREFPKLSLRSKPAEAAPSRRKLPHLSFAAAGWKRLWAVLSLIYLSVVICLAWHLYPTNPYVRLVAEAAVTETERSPLDIFGPANSQPPSPENNVPTEAATTGTKGRPSLEEIFDDNLQPPSQAGEQRRFIVKAALWGLSPVVAAYLLGVAWYWVYRGFQPAKTE